MPNLHLTRLFIFEQKGHGMRKIQIFGLLIISLSSIAPGFSQEPVDLEMIAKIREAGFQRSEVMDIAGYILDVLGPRLTASQDARRAQRWAKAKMEEIGLQNTALEPFEFKGISWDMSYVSIHMLEPDYYPLIGFPLAFSPGTNGRIKGVVEHLVITQKDSLERYRGKLRDKIIFISPIQEIPDREYRERRTEEELARLAGDVIPEPWKRRRRESLHSDVTWEELEAFYKSEGVTLLVQTGSGGDLVVRTFARPGSNSNYTIEEVNSALPRISLVPEHYNRICRILARGIPVQIETDIRVDIKDVQNQDNNVVGEIPGSDLEDQLVMAGAHLDSWHTSPGATDDAAGCAVVLEAMRLLKVVNARPRRTIRIALWSGEEEGIHGSREYVKQHFGSPETGLKPDYDNFSAYFNMDNSCGRFRGIYLQANEYVRPIFNAWMKPLEDLSFTTMTIQNTGSTDHMSFDKAGLPGFQFIQDHMDQGRGAGHTNNDFFERLTAEDLQINAVIMACFLYHAAMRKEKIPRKSVEK